MPELSYKSRLLLEESLPFRDGLKLDDGTDGVLLLETLTLNGNVNTLRSQPHTSKLYLAIAAPQVASVAVLSVTSITTPTGLFPQSVFYALVSGDDTKIVAGMTAWVGTSADDYSLGRVRVRAAPAGGLIFLAENSDIAWSVGTIISVYDEFLCWPKYPVITDTGVIYKDYLIGFSNQTVQWNPVAMMLSPLVALESAGQVTFVLTGAESYATAPGATIASYLWGIYQSGILIPGTNYAVATPGSITLTAGVDYLVGIPLEIRLTVTDSNGKTHTGHRPAIFVDTSNPAIAGHAYTDFSVSNFSGDVDTGWGANFEVFGLTYAVKQDGSIGINYFPNGSPVFLYEVAQYGTNAGGNGFPGFERFRTTVKYFGYLLEGTLQINPQTNSVSFQTGSIARVAAKQYGWPTIVQDKASPATWSEGYALTMRRALLYYLFWHTTILDIADTLIGIDATPIQIADFPKASLWDVLRNFISSTRNGHASVTKNGRILIARDMMMLTQAERDAQAVVMQLQANDWKDSVEISEDRLDNVAFVDFSGVWYEGSPAANPIAIFSKAPGDAPSAYGNDLPVQYQVLDSQLTSNTLAGQYREWKNSTYPKITIRMAGNWVSAFDPGYVEWVKAPLEGWVTKHGMILADTRMTVREMGVEADTRNGVMLPTIVLEMETPIVDGAIGDYPLGSLPPQASACPLGQYWDTATRACLPLGSTPSPYPWADTWRADVWAAAATTGVYHTQDFTGADEPSLFPTWGVVNDGRVATSVQQMTYDPYNPSTLYLVEPFVGSNSRLYRYTADTGEWTLLWDAKTWAAALGITSGGVLLDEVFFSTIITDPNQAAGWVGMILCDADAPNYTTWFSKSADYGTTWSAAVKIANSGGAGRHQSVQYRGCAGTSGGAQTIYVPVQTQVGSGTCTLYYSVNGGVSWTASAFGSASGRNFEHGVAVIDPNDKTRLWYAQDGIRLYSATATVETLKLAAVGCSTTLYNKYAIEPLYNASGSATTIRVFDENDAVHPKRLYTSTDGGTSWASVDSVSLPSNGAPYGLLTLLDAPNKFYAISFGLPSTPGSTYLIWVSDDGGVTYYGKSGTVAGTALYPADGSGIPYDVLGIVDIVPLFNVH